MNKIALSIISFGFIIALVIIFSSGSEINNTNISTEQLAQNTEIKDGVQYITINAKGGYFPRSSVVKAEIPTKLIVKTNGTYDCSAALVIRSIGYQNILPQTGEEVIDIGTKKAGEKLQGLCGMGMYGFEIEFK